MLMRCLSVHSVNICQILTLGWVIAFRAYSTKIKAVGRGQYSIKVIRRVYASDNERGITISEQGVGSLA